MMANVTKVDLVQKELEVDWMQKMSEFEKRLKAALVPSNPTLVQLSEEFYAFKDLVSNMFSILQQQFRRCTNAVDEIDMRQRRKVLLFNGIPEESGLNVEQEVLEIVHNKLGLSHISNSSLKRCHRLGAPGSDRTRAVLVHFQSYDTKSEVWRSKAKLKNTPYTVSEFLTKMRQGTYKKARRHFGMKNVWTLDGTINIRLPDSSRIKISTEEEFDILLTKWPKPNSPSVTAQKSPLETSSQQGGARRRQVIPAVQSVEIKKTRRVMPKK